MTSSVEDRLHPGLYIHYRIDIAGIYAVEGGDVE